MIKKYKIKQISAFFILSVLFVSCEEWLDVSPTTQLERSKLLSTEAGYKDALSGVYSLMTGTNLYGREMSFGTLDILSGYYSPETSGSSIYYNLSQSYPYKFDDPNKDQNCVAIIDNMWSGMYNAVSNINSMLETIDSKKDIFSNDNYNLIKGECIGLRAFLHFDLLRMYGASYAADPEMKCIPYVENLDLTVAPLLTVKQASNKIISELETALALMENDPLVKGEAPSNILASTVATTSLSAYHNRKYRFNYYAVAATLARAYLWKGDKVNALKYAKKVIEVQSARFPWVTDNNLVNINSSTAANKDRTFTTEHIFGLNIRAFESIIPLHFNVAGQSSGLRLSTTSTVKNSIYENQTADPRNQYLFVSFNSDFLSSKLFQDQEASTWFKYQMPMIRISEMYYIAAECEPNIADALNWLNTVRTVRKLDNLTAATITSDQALLNEIRKEYEKEFINEGQLWFFYKRQNLSTLPNTYNFTDTKLYVFDRPQDEIVNGGR